MLSVLGVRLNLDSIDRVVLLLGLYCANFKTGPFWAEACFGACGPICIASTGMVWGLSCECGPIGIAQAGPFMGLCWARDSKCYFGAAADCAGRQPEMHCTHRDIPVLIARVCAPSSRDRAGFADGPQRAGWAALVLVFGMRLIAIGGGSVGT